MNSLLSNPSASCRDARRAFTMVEILVVMSIIIILATLSLPAIGLLTGSRSIEAGETIAAATLSRARTEAITRQQPVGLAVYFDQEKQRTALALVGYAQKWSPTTTYRRGDYIYTDDARAGAVSTSTRFWWLCHTQHTSHEDPSDSLDGAPNVVSKEYKRWSPISPVDPNGRATDRGSPANPNYLPTMDPTNMVEDRYISILPESEVTYLPPGVDAQVLNSAQTPSIPNARATDRYLRVSVIFFDADGKLDLSRKWAVMFEPADLPPPMSTSFTPTRGDNFFSSRLGMAIRFNTNGVKPDPIDNTIHFHMDPLPTTTNNQAELTSGLGLILYDRAAYLGVCEQLDPNDPTSGRYWDDQVMGVNHSNSGDASLERWLDQNGKLLTINQYTGTLIKTE